MTPKAIDKLDQILIDCIVAIGVREEGTVMDLDTLIIDRQKATDVLLKWRAEAVVAEADKIFDEYSFGGKSEIEFGKWLKDRIKQLEAE